MAPIGDESTQIGSPSPAQLDGALGEVLLAEAARLARRGRWVEAEAALGFPLAPGRPTRGAALDLLARIRGQQGRWADAKAAWTEALRLDPENEAYSAGLRRLSRRPTWLAHSWLMLLIVIAALGLIVVLGFRIL